jgi:hypothetical protein
LDTLLAFLRPGDTLIITRVDRLARSIGDLQDIVRVLQTKKVGLKATEQPIDTSTAAGKAFLDMLGVFAEFETNLRRERQMEGITRAKAEGVYKGRRPSIDPDKVREMHAQGIGASEIALRLKIGRASVYRLLQESSSTLADSGVEELPANSPHALDELTEADLMLLDELGSVPVSFEPKIGGGAQPLGAASDLPEFTEADHMMMDLISAQPTESSKT